MDSHENFKAYDINGDEINVYQAFDARYNIGYRIYNKLYYKFTCNQI